MGARGIARVVALGAALWQSNAVAQEQRLAFVSCPIVRDTKTVPCWLSEFNGTTYYLGIQTDVSADFFPPSLGNLVLVEGEVSNDTPICGGVPLKNVSVSVIQDRAEHCSTLLPVEERYNLPFTPPRPPGPSMGQLAFRQAPPEKPRPPFSAKTFNMLYDFDMTVGFKHPRTLMQVVVYANDTKAKRIEITGYRGRTALSDGGALTERENLGAIRAKEVETLLRSAGLNNIEYRVNWVDEPEEGDATRRRVSITVTP